MNSKTAKSTQNVFFDLSYRYLWYQYRFSIGLSNLYQYRVRKTFQSSSERNVGFGTFLTIICTEFGNFNYDSGYFCINLLYDNFNSVSNILLLE